jgi:hypothetical protein
VNGAIGLVAALLALTIIFVSTGLLAVILVGTFWGAR